MKWGGGGGGQEGQECYVLAAVATRGQGYKNGGRLHARSLFRSGRRRSMVCSLR